jgi:FkbM family methyltransferase
MTAHRYRDRTALEALAETLPSAGAFGRVRAAVAPLARRWLARRGALESRLPGGEVVRVAAGHRHVTWNPAEYAAFRATVSPGATVLDAGANVGAYTVLFGQWVGDRGHVYAFEPDPAAFAGLSAHVALNGLSQRVTAVRCAITDGSAARVRLSIPGPSGISSIVTGTGAPRVDVDAVSIDRFCLERGIEPDVIKIDVEGAELQALRGARDTIARRGPSVHLFVEMHPSIWRASGVAVEDVRCECAALGLAAEPLDGVTSDPWTMEGVCVRLRLRGAS